MRFAPRLTHERLPDHFNPARRDGAGNAVEPQARAFAAINLARSQPAKYPMPNYRAPCIVTDAAARFARATGAEGEKNIPTWGLRRGARSRGQTAESDTPPSPVPLGGGIYVGNRHDSSSGGACHHPYRSCNSPPSTVRTVSGYRRGLDHGAPPPPPPPRPQKTKPRTPQAASRYC